MLIWLALACAACSGEISAAGGTIGADEPNLDTPDLVPAGPVGGAAGAGPVADDSEVDPSSDERNSARPEGAASDPTEPATPDPEPASPGDVATSAHPVTGDSETDTSGDDPGSSPHDGVATDPSGPPDGADEAGDAEPSDGVDETHASADAYHAADPSELHVESGVIEVGADELRLRSATVRATLGAQSRTGLELRFESRGVSAVPAPLASGELRRQIGIKLRAQNTCNVVYVMWHIAPSTGIHVSVKSNPGQSLHSECTDHGYLQLGPSFTREVAPIEDSQPRTLEAHVEGTTLRVSVDGSVVWDGPLPAAAFAFDGPVGLRSDNGDFDVGLRVPE